ncbi:glycoside hydrolase family 78 protein [Niabella ginsengisoli]|uniref:Alpha-rhamnosidase n=1 Tax=Niabella ginsengisoli TaxID=522298 RepID=A0ABS9SHI3_9BACT|nr:hypothetical protein [Niabella ginsengisoli]MCH5597812.1 hypothetical protein [Niabella ginsengisoli]
MLLNKKYKLSLLLLLLFSYLVEAQVQVQNLLVEQQSHPIGIATSQPRFSWQITSDKRNVEQTAYEIIVASSKTNIEKSLGDVWSSGKINTDHSILVPFKGSQLYPNRYYYCKVKVYTNKGDIAWSKPMFFTLGFINKSDWKAQWIGYEKAFPWDSISQWSRLSARYFRKEFSSSKK